MILHAEPGKIHAPSALTAVLRDSVAESVAEKGPVGKRKIERRLNPIHLCARGA
jgi:hypothetical protein